MLVSVLSVPAMIMYGTSCFIFCLVALVLITCKIMGLLDSDPGQRLTPARLISQIMDTVLQISSVKILPKETSKGV